MQCLRPMSHLHPPRNIHWKPWGPPPPPQATESTMGRLERDTKYYPDERWMKEIGIQFSITWCAVIPRAVMKWVCKTTGQAHLYVSAFCVPPSPWIADSARVVRARLLHSQHHIAARCGAVGTLQLHRSLGSNPWKPALSFWVLDEVSVVGSHRLPGLALGHHASMGSLLCCPELWAVHGMKLHGARPPLDGSYHWRSTGLQPTRCISTKGGGLAGTVPGLELCGLGSTKSCTTAW